MQTGKILILTKSVISFLKTVRKDKELLVILSCVQMSTPASKSNITIALGIKPSKKQKRKKKNQYTKKDSRDVSEIGAPKTKENEPKENKMKRPVKRTML